MGWPPMPPLDIHSVTTVASTENFGDPFKKGLMPPMLSPTGGGPIVRFSARDYSRDIMCWREMMQRHIVSLETELKDQFLGKPFYSNSVGQPWVS